MSYEQGLKPLRQVQLSTLSPVMWSLKGGYPRKQMSVPIGMSGLEDCASGQMWNPATNSCVDVLPHGPIPPSGRCAIGQMWNPVTRRCVDASPHGPTPPSDRCAARGQTWSPVLHKCVEVPLRRPFGSLGGAGDTVNMIGSTAGMLVILPLVAFLGIAALGVLANVVNGREPLS